MPELDTILQTAERILNPDPDPVVRLRLLRDRSEKNGRWPTGWRLSAASTPAQIQPHHPALDSIWELWIPVAGRIFSSGTYNRQAEISSHRELTGARWQTATQCCTTNTHTLLSSHADALPRDVEIALFDWVWHNEGTVRHLGETPSIVPGSLEVAKIDRWLRCLELLASVPSWDRRARGAIRWLWERRSADGWWDLG